MQMMMTMMMMQSKNSRRRVPPKAKLPFAVVALLLIATALILSPSWTRSVVAAEEDADEEVSGDDATKPQQSPPQPPNVVLILLDDLGVADVSFSARRLNAEASKGDAGGGGDMPYEAPIETPEIDAIAENRDQTAQLTNAFTHAMCGPSRAAIVTGRLAHNLGNPFPMLEGGSLDKRYKTVAHEFKLRGYTTHFIGKWGIDYPRPSDEVLARSQPSHEVFNGHTPGMGPTERGFDTFYGLYSSAHNHYTKEVMFANAVDWHRHNKTHKLNYPDVDNEPNEYSTHLFTREAISVIKRWSSSSSSSLPKQPGFLHLSYTAPHDPLQAPSEYMDRPSCKKKKNWRRRTYCAMVSAIDEGIGEIRRALEDSGLAENTVILFSTDNGGAPSVGGFNYPYRGQKATIYEGGLRNPAFLHVPAGVGGGSATTSIKVRSHHYSNVVHIADFSPTLLGIVDRASGNVDGRLGKYEALGDDIDGVDHSEFILRGGNFDSTATTPPRTSAVLEFNAAFDHAAYLEGEWKLLLGAAGIADRFEEPTGRWYDRDQRPRFVVEEAVCDAVDGLGPNWFLYGWAMRFMVDRAFDAFKPTGGGEVTRARTSRLLDIARNSPYGATIEIDEDRLPKADFSKFDPTEIQLYNIKDDPYEDRNIAYDNQDKVLEMLDRLQAEVKGDPGHNFALQKFFIERQIRPMVVFIVAPFCFVAMINVFLYYLFCGRHKSKQHMKRKEKKM